MVVVDRLEHSLELVHGHVRHRREGFNQALSIGINLLIYLLHILFQHGIIGINLPVKGQIAACLPLIPGLDQAMRLVLFNLLRFFLHRLVSGPVAQRAWRLHRGIRLLIAVLALQPVLVDARLALYGIHHIRLHVLVVEQAAQATGLSALSRLHSPRALHSVRQHRRQRGIQRADHDACAA